MPAAGAFGVIRVNSAIFERGDRVFDESGFIERVRVNRNLDIEFIGDAQALVDRCRSGPPIFVQFQSQRTRANLLAEGFRQRGIAFAEEPEIQGERFGGFIHAAQIPRARRAGCGVSSRGRAGAASDQSGDA